MSGTVLMTDFFALLIIESLPKTVMLIPIHFNLYMAATTQLSLTYDLLEILVIGPMLEIVLLIEFLHFGMFLRDIVGFGQRCF